MKKLLTVIIIIVIVVGIYFIYKSVANKEGGEMMDDEMTSEEVGYTDISPAEAKDMIDNNANLVVIDVSPNYAQGHLPGALEYPLGDGSLDMALPALDKNMDYLVYCHTDSASMSGAEKLVEAGFDPVYRLEGNYAAWVDAGYPIEQ